MANEEERVDKLAKDAESNARSMEKGTEELGEKVEETRSDWKRKDRDSNVPGAPAPDEGELRGENPQDTPD